MSNPFKRPTSRPISTTIFTSNPFGSNVPTFEDKVRAIASHIHGEERKIRDELRGDKESFDSIMFYALKEISDKKRIEKREADRKATERRNHESVQTATRAKKNLHLKKYGYKWRKNYVSTEEDNFPGGYGAGIGEIAGFEWQLISDDGRVVSVKQAMDEIEASLD